MDSKRQILEAIRRQAVPAAELPEMDGEWLVFENPRRQFAEVLSSVGGACVRVRDLEQLNRELKELPSYACALQICSSVPGAGAPNVDPGQITDPHALESVDFAVLPGEFGVAENGAVWVTDKGLPHRVLYFIVQHLALVIPADQIVHNMHEAYARLSLGSAGFGAFISGPSKTADIEQSLVIGAHGPRSLTVFLLGAED